MIESPTSTFSLTEFLSQLSRFAAAPLTKPTKSHLADMAHQSPPGILVPVRFKPTCTHLTMTRLYGFEFVCDACRRPGPFGWVYCCTQDREVMIESAVAAGCPIKQYFDGLGEYWSSKLRIRAGSAEARADPLSLFDELTPQQMSQYRPEQIQTLLRQRESVSKFRQCWEVSVPHRSSGIDLRTEKVRNATSRDNLRRNPMSNHQIFEPYQDAIFLGTENPRPWVPSLEHECRYMICPLCRPSAADRSFLSLDGVAKGEVQPTSAVGFGFHGMGERPVVNVDVLRSIGCRPPSLTQSNRDGSTDNSLPESDISLIELLEKQISSSQQYPSGRGVGFRTGLELDGSFSLSQAAEATPKTLKHSPGYDNLSAVFTQTTPEAQSSAQARPAWTPPPSPSPYGLSSASETYSLGFAEEPSITDGRRSSLSLKSNQFMRQQLVHSLPLIESQGQLTDLDDNFLDEERPYEPDYERDAGPAYRSKEASGMASKTTLQMPGPTEEIRVYAQESLVTSSAEGESSLATEYGVAVLEESTELGIPDVITQV
ncbi:unnamed protein product [Clonostachys solani]|uniref:Uncharacterized protein n=1 Tax=Clonostachys solani TaxID=160281 RepID=A0A9N9W6M8_9HYPO|nr:unnamed protein product [Clonostachys solani]